MRSWRQCIAFLVAGLVGACTQAPSSDLLLSPPELTDLVTDHTLSVAPCCDAPNGLMLYLAHDGTGWLDRRATPNYPPTPGGMSMVFNWRVTAESQLCVWATPRIGDMPSFMPVFLECLAVLRSAKQPDELKVTITKNGRSRTAPLYVYPFSAFPQPVIDQYLTQVRVLYGGRVPNWGVPQQMTPYALPLRLIN